MLLANAVSLPFEHNSAEVVLFMVCVTQGNLFIRVIFRNNIQLCKSLPPIQQPTNSVLLWLKTQRYWVQIPVGSDVCHRGCAYTVLQTAQMPGVCSAVSSSVHFKKPLKSFGKSKA